MFEWMEKNADLVFFASPLNCSLLIGKGELAGKLFGKFFFPPAPKKVLKLAGLHSCMQCAQAGFFGKKGAQPYFPKNIFFKKKNLHGQADAFVFLSSLFSIAALSENGSARRGRRKRCI